MKHHIKRTVTEPEEAPAGYIIGYARVSTQEQNLDMQVQALERHGCKWIFQEKVSGASKKRPELAKLWRELRRGDTLVVWRLDRLGRDIRDLLLRINDLGVRGVRFVSLRETIDTETAVGKLMLAITAAMAQFERDLTSERTKAGLAAKKARGERVGPEQRFDREKARKLLADGHSGVEVAKRLGVTRSAIYQAFPVEERQALFRAWQRRKTRG